MSQNLFNNSSSIILPFSILFWISNQCSNDRTRESAFSDEFIQWIDHKMKEEICLSRIKWALNYSFFFTLTITKHNSKIIKKRNNESFNKLNSILCSFKENERMIKEDDYYNDGEGEEDERFTYWRIEAIITQ